jgi:hypothetical protein
MSVNKGRANPLSATIKKKTLGGVLKNIRPFDLLNPQLLIILERNVLEKNKNFKKF